jgi:hypothetical protein
VRQGPGLERFQAGPEAPGDYRLADGSRPRSVGGFKEVSSSVRKAVPPALGSVYVEGFRQREHHGSGFVSRHGFEQVRQQHIPEINSRATLYRHIKTGARLLSLENDDENKVFGINFATAPFDSTGVAHILEHSVLCGSRKYPSKEPFVELLKGSLNTFLNAFTYPDKTCYPVASQNLQDFYNLIDVYLDAVFYPRITPHTLQQEGWHYELDSPEAPLTYKGVVFNEMKGVYSSPDNLLGRYSQQSLFPNNAYGLDSGGDPKRIPELTYEKFKAFHQACYHPSNAFIYFYGDDNPEQRLKLLDECLRAFEPQEPRKPVDLQPRLRETRRVEYGYDAGEQEAGSKKGYFTLNWVLNETTELETTLALNILSHILVGTSAAPLRKALIDSGLGEDLAGGGLEDELRQVSFSTGLKGIAVEDAPKVEALILGTLERLAREGIDRDTVEASLNTIEFALRENNTGGYPRGLALMLRSLRTWLNGGDPLAPLAFEAPLEHLKRAWKADPRYFEKLIQQHFLDNPHRSAVLLKPDPEAGKRAEAEEKARLEAVRKSMSEADVKAVMEKARELKRLQETPDPPEVVATIPMLKLADLDRKNKVIPLALSEAHGTKVLSHDIATNGIVYLDLAFDLHALPQRLLSYVTLFGRSLLEMGTDKEDFVKLSQRIGRKTGGINPSSLTATVRQTGAATTWFLLRGKATTAQAQDLLDILRDVLLTVKLDNRERFRQMVLEERAGLEGGLVPGGHGVVNRRLRSRLNPADLVSEQLNGLEYLFFLRKLTERIEQDWGSVLADLEAVRQRLINRTSLVCNFTLDGAHTPAFEKQLSAFVATLPAAARQSETWSAPERARPEGLTIPAQVNYVGKGANLYKHGYTLHGSALVVTHYLGTAWLWEKVRVQGGAYGGFASFDQRSGVFSFLSYRDPNLLSTLETYDKTVDYLRGLELSQDELTKAIIGVVGDLDTYLLPDARGYVSLVRHLAGDTEETRQKLRDEVLSTSAADFKRFGDALAQVRDHGTVVVLGSEKSISEANTRLAEKMDVLKVL